MRITIIISFIIILLAGSWGCEKNDWGCEDYHIGKILIFNYSDDRYAIYIDDEFVIELPIGGGHMVFSNAGTIHTFRAVQIIDHNMEQNNDFLEDCYDPSPIVIDRNIRIEQCQTLRWRINKNLSPNSTGQ